MTSDFAPIAVVGRGCALPGALDPGRLWDLVVDARCALGPVPRERWGPGGAAGAEPPGDTVAGVVGDVDAVLDPSGLARDVHEVAALDLPVRWALHASRTALQEAGARGPLPRAGLVLGTLAYPSAAAARHAEDACLGRLEGRRGPRAAGPVPAARPARQVAAALGLGGGAVELDAACASALYAVKLACDRLHDRTADLMLAGAVNGADALLVHQAFRAMGALSPRGLSRPLQHGADGLVPAEGAAVVALARLEDALADGVEVLAVIRGVGLSNDARARGGLLTPSTEGQLRALRAAYAVADVDPRSVSLVECHATGTPVGDATEIEGLARFFDGCDDLPIGSVKSNIGHPLAPAGAAGLLKVVEALRSGTRPPTARADEPHHALHGTPMRLLRAAERWPGHRRAALSAFGFGGANAHVVLEQAPRAGSGGRGSGGPARPPRPATGRSDLAVVAVAGRGAGLTAPGDLLSALRTGRVAAAGEVDLDAAGLPFPPHALRDALPSQALLVDAAREAVAAVRLPRDRTTVVVGSHPASAVTRFGARWRVPARLAVAPDLDPSELAAVADALSPPLTAARVVGTLPNVVANRLNAVCDLGGPGFAVFAAEHSGGEALRLGARALRSGEADAALVAAAVDGEPADDTGAAGTAGGTAGPFAVLIVLKRLADARAAGDAVLAVLPDDRPGDERPAPVAVLTPGGAPGTGHDPARTFGETGAAAEMLAVAVAATALHHRLLPVAGGPAVGLPPTAPPDRLGMEIAPPPGGAPAGVRLVAADRGAPRPRLRPHAGADRAAVLAAVAAGRESVDGPCRLVLLGEDDDELDRTSAAAVRWLLGEGPKPADAAWREAPVPGGVAFVHTNGAATYPGMGGPLTAAVPGLLAAARRRYALDALDGDGDGALDRILRAVALGAVHTELTRHRLGLDPAAVIGYSSGEVAALVATGTWRDVPALVRDIRASPLFRDELCGGHRAARRWWAASGTEPGRGWAVRVVLAPADRLRAALVEEPAVALMAVNAPDVCVVGGAAARVDAVVDRLGVDSVPLDYDVAAHIEALHPLHGQLAALHRRPVTPPAGLRFYSATGAPPLTDPTSEDVAAAVADQAVTPLDVVRTVERAYADGIRVFVEHGPQGMCSGWIRRILGDRDHVAVALDARGVPRQPWRALAELVAAGVLDDLSGVDGPGRRGPAVTVRVPLRPAGPVRPVRAPAPAVMAAAPPLPPTAAARHAPTPVPPRVPAPWAARAAAPASHPAPAPAARGRDGAARAHRAYLRSLGLAHRAFLRGRAGHRPGTPPPGTPVAARPGPSFGRAELERLARGRVSDVLGPLFAPQDGRRHQTRMPMPPLLLADRVTGIDAEPGGMGAGRIWTETDVAAGRWFLDGTGRVPPGLFVEAGQADLLLISWLGIDLVSAEDRLYRLLGCTIEFHGPLPVPGDVLDYEIAIDRHVEHAGVRLFSFRYDCRIDGRLRLTLRDGQAGHFTQAELDGSQGVAPGPGRPPAADEPPPEPPPVAGAARSFPADAVAAFVAGRPQDCFGPRWADAARDSPRTPAGRLRLLHEVTAFEPHGGPWGRGHLRAHRPVRPDDWFFESHFLDDPCMPGTLMLEGALQAMAFYLAASGYTVGRDGWRFEPVPGRPTTLSCRGQVTPRTSRLVHELFVVEMRSEPYPTLVADVLGTADDLPAFRISRAAVRLVPGPTAGEVR